MRASHSISPLRYDLSIPLGLSAYLAYVVTHDQTTPMPQAKKVD